jgi:N-methylhydantoinase B
MQLDPITFEVVKHRLWQINDEQGVTIRTISTSPIVVEGNDMNVGLFTKDGDLVVAGPYVLLHVTTMDTVIKNVIRLAEDVEDGDIFLVNDPYLGALHQNDVAVVSPFFHNGEIILWIGNVLHHADLAGIDEGSFCINAVNVYQEAPRYFLKVAQRGKVSREVERTFVTNTRLPDMVSLDLRAQVGAINVARRRMQELIEQRSAETVLAVMDKSVDYAEQQLRERLRELPDGSWYTEVFMDTDRVGSDRLLRVCLRLDKRGEELFFDYTGSDPQAEGAVNCTYSASYAGTTTPIYTFLCSGEIDWNGAIKRLVKVHAPEGTMMNARYPAAVSICSIGFSWMAAVAAMQVVAQMVSESEQYKDRICPSWSVSCNANNLFGVTEKGKSVGALLSDHRAIGGGARSFADGFDFAGQIFSCLSFTSNVESQEWKLPLLYVFRRQLTDSGGPGKFRGGLSALSAVVPYRAQRMIWKSQNTAGSDESNAAGIHGGYPGAGSQVSVIRNTNLWEQYARSEVPLTYEAFQGEVEHQATKSQGILGRDDVFIYYPPGGGGYGDPLDRDPERVRQDVLNGAVSREWARKRYGVVLTDGVDVDAAATGRERQRQREERLGDAATRRPDEEDGTADRRRPTAGDGAVTGEDDDVANGAGTPSPRSSPRGRGDEDERPNGATYGQSLLSPSPRLPVPPSGTPLGEYLERVDLGGERVIRCRCCEHVLCRDDEDPREHGARRVAPLAEAGPWLALNWQGHSPRFVLVETACPSCGVLYSVEEKLRAEVEAAGTAAIAERVSAA